MNGEGRFLRSLRLEQPDGCPVFLRDLTLALDHVGIPTPLVCSGRYDGERSADAVLAYHRRTGQDAVVGCIHHLGIDVGMLGGRVDYPDWGIPSVVSHPFAGVADEDFPAVDPLKDGQWPQVLESYRRVHESGISAAVVCNIEGPVTKAAILRGLEAFIMDMYSEPGFADALLRYATGMGCDVIEEASRHSDCVFIAAATDNPDLVGPALFLRNTVPHLKQLESKTEKCGLPTVFHPHGDISSAENFEVLNALLDTGVDGIQFAEGNDHGRLKGKVGNRACLMGGVDVHSTLLLGPEERIVNETRSFLDDFDPWNGYVFMCSCSLHRGMPLDNVDMMLAEVMRYRRPPNGPTEDTG